ncbi:hypothetical protein CR103_08225 [Massilia psychrophila]|uniref:Potassium-transporting ATPase subunit C n=1 Tax=Massilia psychrophila TaxID=1603353 RepID=A0A2G8T3X6_9BURK|nr:hypothetical protein CR103_08225 [Massilia psychrophila]GGE78393.1 hypothetical protein GCM10008020_23930 [Massilia psychrophila]
MKSTLRPALVLFGALTLVVGVLYPLAVTGIGQLAFADKASGSLVLREGKPVGSTLIGQLFSSPGYFWGRPSATGPMPNNARFCRVVRQKAEFSRSATVPFKLDGLVLPTHKIGRRMTFHWRHW